MSKPIRMQTMRLDESYMATYQNQQHLNKNQMEERRYSIHQKTTSTNSNDTKSSSESIIEINPIDLNRYFQACLYILKHPLFNSAMTDTSNTECKPHKLNRNWLKHQCNIDECSFIQCQSLWICLSTGCVHECTHKTCDQCTITSSGKVCLISGINYDELQHYEIHHDKDGEEEETFYPYKGPGLATVEFPCAQLIQRCINVEYLHQRKRQRIAKSNQIIKKIENKTRKRHIVKLKQLIQFTNDELDELKNQIKTLIQDAFIQSVSSNIENDIINSTIKCWRLVLSTEHGKLRKAQYKFEYHVYACLYDCIDGFSTSENVYLPKYSILNEALISKPALLSKFQKKQQYTTINKRSLLTSAKLTTATRILHMCVTEFEKNNQSF